MLSPSREELDLNEFFQALANKKESLFSGIFIFIEFILNLMAMGKM
jgi:hypothetical protein